MAHRLPSDFLERLNIVESQITAYGVEQQQIRTFKRQILLTLSFFTMLLLFATTWCALYLAKQVTVPIQALAEATHEVTAGRFDTKVRVHAQDELGALVGSFNEMTAQLADSRHQIDDFTHNLQQAVQELDRRRILIETVLENIPTAVLSLDSDGKILRMNTAARQIFGGSNARHRERRTPWPRSGRGAPPRATSSISFAALCAWEPRRRNSCSTWAAASCMPRSPSARSALGAPLPATWW